LGGPLGSQGLNQYELLRYAAMAARWHEPAKDALDRLVLGAVDLPSLDAVEQLAYVPFDPVTKRTEGTVRLPSGETFRVTKGAPNIVLGLIADSDLVTRVRLAVHGLSLRGIRALAVARTTKGVDEPWVFLGMLTFLDPPRPDTRDTIEKAGHFGVPVRMITGDHVLIAKETARQLGMGTNILDPIGLPHLGENNKIPDDLKDYGPIVVDADGFGQVFPEHKFLIVECLRLNGYKVGMTGDGVNDGTFPGMSPQPKP
jgi:H+-transporting ATPase